MTVGASRAGPTITRQPALAPSPQPRPAPTARALPPKLVAQGGQNWTPIEGQIWKPIDSVGFGGSRESSVAKISSTALSRGFFESKKIPPRNAKDSESPLLRSKP